jgi:ankyrin repeat protein
MKRATLSIVITVGLILVAAQASRPEPITWKHSRLLAVAKAGNLDQVKTLLRQNPGLAKMTDKNGWTALHLAARGGHLAVVILLLDKGADVNARTTDRWVGRYARRGGVAPLHMAAYSGRLEVVTTLIARGAKLNPRDGWGFSALHYAVQGGNAAVVQLLLDKGVHRTKPDNPWARESVTPLHLAARRGRLDLAELLIVRGARVNAKVLGYPQHTPATVAPGRR